MTGEEKGKRGRKKLAGAEEQGGKRPEGGTHSVHTNVRKVH